MSDNILSALIKVEAPGVANTATQVASSVSKMQGALKNLAPTSSSATQSLINLGRVVQDAPYGFIGIANNINPLLESFQRLKAESASTGAAMKAFAGSLMGAGGLGLAVSVVTSLLLTFTGGASKAKDETKQLNKEADEAKKKQEDFQNALDAASRSVVSQANKLNDLRDILINTNQAVQDLTASTINQGVAQFLFDQKNLAVQKLLSAEVEKQLKLRKQERPFSTVPEMTMESVSKDPLVRKIAAAKDEVRQLNDLSFGLESIISGLFNKSYGTGTLKIKPKKVEIDKPEILDPGSIFDAQTITVSSTQKAIERLSKIINQGAQNIPFQIPVELTLAKKRNQDALEPMKQKLLELKKMGEFVGNGLADAFNNAFDALANGNNPIKALGESIKKLVVDLIQAAIRAFVVKKIIGLFAPGLGSVGGSLGSVFGKLAGFAEGGRPPVGRASIVGERGPELFVPSVPGTIIPNNRLSSFGNTGFGGGMSGDVYFRIAGTELVGVLARANKSLGNLS